MNGIRRITRPLYAIMAGLACSHAVWAGSLVQEVPGAARKNALKTTAG